jgi:hypothetical protein
MKKSTTCKTAYKLATAKKSNISILSVLAGLLLVLFGQSASAQLPTPSGRCFGSDGGSASDGTVEHWDKIVFSINYPTALTATVPGTNFTNTPIPLNTELDIKVLDDPDTVADLRENVISFVCGEKLKNQCSTEGKRNLRRFIRIISVDYAIICGADGVG